MEMNSKILEIVQAFGNNAKANEIQYLFMMHYNTAVTRADINMTYRELEGRTKDATLREVMYLFGRYGLEPETYGNIINSHPGKMMDTKYGPVMVDQEIYTTLVELNHAGANTMMSCQDIESTRWINFSDRNSFYKAVSMMEDATISVRFTYDSYGIGEVSINYVGDLKLSTTPRQPVKVLAEVGSRTKAHFLLRIVQGKVIKMTKVKEDQCPICRHANTSQAMTLLEPHTYAMQTDLMTIASKVSKRTPSQ